MHGNETANHALHIHHGAKKSYVYTLSNSSRVIKANGKEVARRDQILRDIDCDCRTTTICIIPFLWNEQYSFGTANDLFSATRFIALALLRYTAVPYLTQSFGMRKRTRHERVRKRLRAKEITIRFRRSQVSLTGSDMLKAVMKSQVE